MKKAAILLFLVLFIPGASRAVEAPKVYIYDFDGNSSLTTRDLSQPLKQDMNCPDGSILRTDVNGTADITVNHILAIRVFESSELQIIKSKESDMQFFLKKGSAMVNMRPLPAGAAFEFKTPAGAALVRETLFSKFYVKIDAPDPVVGNSSYFIVKAGKMNVRITLSGAVVNVFEEMTLRASDNVTVPNQKNATEEELEILRRVNAIVIDQGDYS